MKLRTTRACLSTATFLSATLLAACGGGGGGIGSSGTGNGPGGTTNAPGDGLATGTVNGFGSIFVAGVRCDDTRAKVATNTAAGTPETGTPELKLGQRVEISFDPASAACKVLQALVDPELLGVVTGLTPLTVAGQRVLTNTDASLAPPTVLEGYADASAIKLGDRVEVHGAVVAQGGLPAVLATRIERKPGTDMWVRARGVVANLSATQFVIGGLTVKRDSSTKLDPSTLALANGQTVVVWSNTAAAADGSVTASVIRLARRTLNDQQAVRVEGPASGCPSAASTPCTLPTVDGFGVDLSSATFTTGTQADVANGVALRVEGRWDAARARLLATKASVRLRDAAAGNVTLIGGVSDFVSSTEFTVRGVSVTTNANTTVAAGCSVAAGQIVAVTGTLAQTQVVAKTVDCLSLVDGTTLDIFGGVLNVDTTARSFNLTEGPYRSFTLTWDADTVFGTGVSAATLASTPRVGLHAVLVDGKLLVKRIVADPVPSAPPGVQLFGNFGIAHDVSATSITVNRIQMNIVAGTSVVTGNLVDGTAVRTWFYRSGPQQAWLALKVSVVGSN